jgi:hypothetical protein
MRETHVNLICELYKIFYKSICKKFMSLIGALVKLGTLNDRLNFYKVRSLPPSAHVYEIEFKVIRRILNITRV